jgi:hypothetical protein
MLIERRKIEATKPVIIQVELGSQASVAHATAALESHGLRVLRSFDLQNALAAVPECDCPHHGTSRCTCQYTILLVYGPGPAPIAVAVHGRDEQTWLAIMPGGESEARGIIGRVLVDTFSTSPSAEATL